ncbi:phosphotransferase system, mannose/fructose/N-acetylgalactosamine-specific component IID [Vibrio vulnificus YJ016]|uniref:PTS N-acetylgalactosamine transporter subunit IID n=3 Tax=Vibrio TaxID=662 RepID=A0A3N3DQB5_9VIBR|nr:MULTISPECIES: PTS system mannose/fructose/sorbose family transporter subunit IID [Vibrio]ELM6648804.1 PTS system mannose/fructose/sorbose family transporter subunit IID [Vibrio vulnificus]MCG6285432.1 PTS system mannose/fructose/sorbose family transporter subunit IID [Vibrio vulnificus]OLQ90117.1 PTS N-acetylgalactosamine transporter subunit IID [Vibrio panuliri]OLQ94163.1 PTS N-acetylgalactosamine transporter subunit IID [Vibrio ponticus]PWY34335.1 PTS system mannose/fructose/sorbose famil
MNSNAEMTMNPDQYHEDAVSSVISNTDSYSDQAVKKVITKQDLWKIGFRGLLMEGNFNFNRMQAGGFCYSISPALKKIHQNPEDLKKALKNNLQFYNANPKMFTLPLGLAIAMEESKEKPSTIASVKAATMGSVSGVGDALDHSVMLPLTLAIGSSIALQGNPLGVLVFFVLYQAYRIPMYFWLLFLGYNAGVSALEKLSDQAEKLGRAANIVGLGVIGSMVAKYVKVSTVIELEAGAADISLQTGMLDKLMPNLLPMALVWLMYYLVKKGKSPTALIFGILFAGVSGHLVGIF